MTLSTVGAALYPTCFAIPGCGTSQGLLCSARTLPLYLSGIVDAMELRHLRYFVAVAEEANISQAARRLNLSQPPLSRQIRDLEEELGVPLLKRSGNRLALTEAGRIFRLEAESVLQRVETAVSFTRAVVKRKNHLIRVGHSAASSLKALPRILRSFQRMQNQAKVELHTMTTREIAHGLRSGELDIGLSVCGPSDELLGFVVEQLGAYDALVAAPKKHRFARLRKVPVRDVAREPVITVLRSDYPWYNSYIAGFLSIHNHSFQVAEEHESAQSVIAAVAAGRGVAIIYDVMAPAIGDRAVARVLHPAPPRAPLVLFYRKEGKTPIMSAFIQAARSAKGL